MAETTPESDTAAPRRTLLKGAGGRTTQPTNFNPFAGMPYAFVPRRLLSGLDLTQSRPGDFAPWQLMQILADSHTDVGLAVWNFLRLGSRGFSYTVQTLAGQDDDEGKALLDSLTPALNAKYGGLHSLHKQWLLSWYFYGAVCGELALTQDLNNVLDIFPVNPFTILFRRDAATQAWVMYQQQLYGMGTGRAGQIAGTGSATSAPEGGYRQLNDTLVSYTPCDPTIDDPYGRMPSGTVINEVFFDIGFLADLKKIVHGAAIPRYVVKIIEEILAKSCPVAIKNDPNKYSAWLDDRFAETQAAFNDLEPDEAFVVFDSVEIGIPTAQGGSNVLALVDTLSRVIERRLIKALKMLPILMASNESTTETHGSVQFEIFAEGIADAQQAISAMCARMFTLMLQVHGRQCRVTCEFASIHTADRLLAANAENKEIVNELLKWAAGFQDQDAASVAITGSKAIAPALPGFLESMVPVNKPPSAEAPAGGGK